MVQITCSWGRRGLAVDNFAHVVRIQFALCWQGVRAKSMENCRVLCLVTVVFKVIVDLENAPGRGLQNVPLVKVEVVCKPTWTAVCLMCPQHLMENGDFTPTPGYLFYCLTSLTVRTFSLASNLNLPCCNFSPLRPLIFPVDVTIALLLRSWQQFRYPRALSLPVAPAIPSKLHPPGSVWPSPLFSRAIFLTILASQM